MHINKIKLENFRNYEEQEIDLVNGINLFLGDNAQGKTNIIEAIYICAFGKSYRTIKDNELIMFNKDFCRIDTIYKKNGRELRTQFYIDNLNRKQLKNNEIKIKKIAAHTILRTLSLFFTFIILPPK